jgi:hypothetical protein
MIVGESQIARSAVSSAPVAPCTIAWYSSAVIESWRDAWLKNYFFEDMHSPKIPADLRKRLFRKLQMLRTQRPTPTSACHPATTSRG